MSSVPPASASKLDEILPENEHNNENKLDRIDRHNQNHLNETTTQRTDVVVDASVMDTRDSTLNPPPSISTTNARSILRKSNRYSTSRFHTLSEIGKMILIGVGFPFLGHVLCWYLLPSCTLFNVCMLCWIFSSLVNIIFDLQEKGYPSNTTGNENKKDISLSSKRVRFESNTKFRRLPRPMSRREKAEFVQRRFEGPPSLSSKRQCHHYQKQCESKQFYSKGERRQKHLDRYVTTSSSLMIEDNPSSETNDNNTSSINSWIQEDTPNVIGKQQNEKRDRFSIVNGHTVSTKEEQNDVTPQSDLIGDSETPIARIRRASSSLPPMIDERGGCHRTTCGRNENEHPSNHHNQSIPRCRKGVDSKSTFSSSYAIRKVDDKHTNYKNCNKPVEGRVENKNTSIDRSKGSSKIIVEASVNIVAPKQQQRRRALGDVGNQRL